MSKIRVLGWPWSRGLRITCYILITRHCVFFACFFPLSLHDVVHFKVLNHRGCFLFCCLIDCWSCLRLCCCCPGFSLLTMSSRGREEGNGVRSIHSLRPFSHNKVAPFSFATGWSSSGQAVLSSPQIALAGGCLHFRFFFCFSCWFGGERPWRMSET